MDITPVGSMTGHDAAVPFKKTFQPELELHLK